MTGGCEWGSGGCRGWFLVPDPTHGEDERHEEEKQQKFTFEHMGGDPREKAAEQSGVQKQGSELETVKFSFFFFLVWSLSWN